MQDMLLTVSVVTYLVVLFCGLVIATRGLAELRAMLRPKPGRRSKPAGKRN
jgi:hypothetical protein